MLRQTTAVAVAAALGFGAALGAAGCGEDREGDVQFENGTGTETTGTSTEQTGTGTESSPSSTDETPTETTP